MSAVRRLLAWIVVACASSLAQTPDAQFFESNVRPILRANCWGCHSEANSTSGLSLQTRESILRGGNRGASVDIILNAARHVGDLKMPPNKQLAPDQIATLEKWFAAGLPMPENLAKSKRAGGKHWSFQPLNRAAIPEVANASWPKNPIDNFILAKIEAAKLMPAVEAPKALLLRRLSLDLTGLPPTPEETKAYLADTSANAYEKQVDRLLASPHYGERWGRLWLDIARYADSDGYTIDAPRDIWMYRDWVINAINADLPFDRFTIDQLAGDLAPNPTTEQLIATGFHRNTTSNYEGGIDFEQYRVEAVADRVATTGSAWLGLTLGCARCHDHKFDPVSQREYYQFFAFFNNSDEVDKEADRKFFNKPFLELGSEKEKAEFAVWQADIIQEEAKIRRHIELNPGDQEKDEVLKGLNKEMAALRAKKPKLPRTMIMRDLPTARPAYVHLGGDFMRKGAPVTPGTLAVLPAMANAGPNANRLDLAKWIVDPKNPLTPRVTVNRIWQQYFGRGIVDSEADFGTQGDKPTHPELLDYLALQFIDNGWSQKKLHRLIVTSATYRQSSSATTADPENHLFARQSRLRLDAEIIRDSSLVVSGLFSPKLGGPSVYPPQPAGVSQVTQVRREWKVSPGEDRYRRGMYTFFQRAAPHPSLVVFDAPDASTACTRRPRSNTPLQALTQLNDEASAEFADALARRMTAAAANDDAILAKGYEISLNRAPRPEELERLRRFVRVQRDSQHDPWPAVARVLINLDEFLTRP
ncbi:PSD1 and planctomycete cytochrome C domain-containing protein [Bryobacter aggregatus]|uniref:PSD1 and planctomycete cytochrome C domain-containing protein n=1 Tax=Bryobacter aggregatus TaxID=360054 RepID=UPI00068D56B9